MNPPLPPSRLAGLDLARFIAFVGMVLVNFKIVMGADGDTELAGLLTGSLEGRAAATFVVLAGVGLGLSSLRGDRDHAFFTTMKRALFLLVIGLVNTLIFDADILHYYAVYFFLAAMMIAASSRQLTYVIIFLNILFLVMLVVLDYEKGWDWQTFTYSGFWTADGFIRNLFFNGWHPVIPWLSFVLFGIIVSRWALSSKATQHRMIIYGVLVVAATWICSQALSPVLAEIDAELSALVTTEPLPPAPLYILTGMGAASFVIGLCLRSADFLDRIGVMAVVTPAGRQTLTLYIAHILLGMGGLAIMGLLGNQTAETALVAALIFCAGSVVYALVWSRFFKRGLIETLMRRVAG